MRVEKRFWEILLALVAGLLLLLPGLVMASVWTSLNLEVAVLSIASSVLTARYLPRLRWLAASVAALVIAVPPYPFWVFRNEVQGWHFHFFHGYQVSNVPITEFVIVFIVAFLLFILVFRAVKTPAFKV